MQVGSYGYFFSGAKDFYDFKISHSHTDHHKNHTNIQMAKINFEDVKAVRALSVYLILNGKSKSFQRIGRCTKHLHFLPAVYTLDRVEKKK